MNELQTPTTNLSDILKSSKTSETLIPQAFVQPPDYFTSAKPELVNKNIDSVITVGKWEICSSEGVQAIDPSGQLIPLSQSIDLGYPVNRRELIKQIQGEKGIVNVFFVTQAEGGYGPDASWLFLPERIHQEFPFTTLEEAKKIAQDIRKNINAYDPYANPRNIDIDEIPEEIPSPVQLFPQSETSFLIIHPDGKTIKVTTAENISDWKSEPITSNPVETIIEIASSQGLKIKKYSEGKARIFNQNNEQLLVLPDSNPVLDPEDKSTVWFIKEGKLNNISCEQIVAGNLEYSEMSLPPEIENCQSVNIDPNGNFLVITSSADNGAKMTFVDKNTLSPFEEVTGVSKAPIIDQESNVIYIDDQKQLRVVANNFKHFAVGQGAQLAEIQEQKMADLRNVAANLQLPEIDMNTAASACKGDEKAANTIEGVMSELNQKINTMFMPLVESANSEAEVQKLRLQLQAIKNQPEFQQYSIVSETIERAMEIKTNQFRTAKLETGISALSTQLPIINSLEGSLSLVKELEKLQNQRNEVNLMLLDPEKAKALQQGLKQIETQVNTIQQNFQGELVNQLQSGLEKVNSILASAETIMELEESKNDPDIRQYLERLNLVSDPKQRTALRRQWAAILDKKQEEIGQIGSARDENRRARAAEIAGDIEASYRSLSKTVEGLLKESNGKLNLTAWKEGSQSVADLREQIRALPVEYQQGYLNKIEEIILKKQKEFQQETIGDRKETKTKGATVKLGNETFPTYQSPLVNVNLGWIPAIKGMDTNNDFGQIVFQTTTGEVWKTGETVRMNVDNPRTQREIKNLKAQAEAKLNPKRRVPELPSEMVLTPSQEKTLETMTRLFRRQLGYNKDLVRERKPRGITIMQGDAGVGKDFSIEIFASLTNREIVSVPCRFSMDPEDVTSEYRFNPKKGTFRVPSQFAQALSKPGTIVNFIEINTMPPEVAKMLNSVFDFKRTLFFTQGEESGSVDLNNQGIGQEIKVNDDVVFVGTMNPENYIGTRPLPQEFKSRARFMDVDYPPYRVAINETSGKQERISVEQTSVPSGFTDIKVLPDEAMILAKQVDTLKTLSSTEFAQLWDHKINKIAGNGADMFDTPERAKAIDNLNHVVKIANKMRQAYRAFQTNEPEAEVFEFVFSLRESQDIIAELAESGSVKEAVSEVVLPKISDPEQRKRAQSIIATS